MLKKSAAAMLMFLSAALSAQPLEVLTVGNSFADSVFVYLPAVAAEAGRELVLERANLPGCTLKRHWELTEAEKPAYKGKSLKTILQSRKWNAVTVQQASGDSWKPETYEPYLTNLIAYIREYAPSAEVVIQQTWSYRFDEPRLAGWGITPEEMFSQLAAAYSSAAKKHGLRMIPTGNAVDLARRTQQPQLVEFPLSALENLHYPDPLPDQTGSFVNGARWGTDAAGNHILLRDSYHLNVRGQYLQACLWFGFLFDENPAEITFSPDALSPSDAEFLRTTAATTLENMRSEQ
ncbi:MAG: DUF4886 domain-containing protein [Victivallaceae bacterium]|nr:DUF4886 domain-containing protein [Victivallaceae bacterium]